MTDPTRSDWLLVITLIVVLVSPVIGAWLVTRP